MNREVKFRIYPNKEQKELLVKTFGCCRFLYNRMLEDKIREYEKSKKMLRNTPAAYKKEFPWLKEVDSPDCIMVLEQGRIIERGTHDQLIEEKGRYYQLYTGNAIRM